MAKRFTPMNSTRDSVFKHTSQGGKRVKTSSMNKARRRSRKKYRGQGR